MAAMGAPRFTVILQKRRGANQMSPSSAIWLPPLVRRAAQARQEDISMPRSTLVCLAAAIVLAACGSTTSAPTSQPSAVAAASQERAPSVATPSPAAASASAVTCPNTHGGRCLGRLAAGTYSTSVFQAPLTYTVADGWANYEDLPGNFLLMPPQASLEGGDAGTADYIGVYDGIAAAASCEERPQEGLDTTPQDIANFLAANKGLAATGPTAVSIGGLDGVVVDLRLADRFASDCPFFENAVPMIIGDGLSPASLHHVVSRDNDTRLYLLDGPNNRTVGIEVNDWKAGGSTMDELDAVVQDFSFGKR
jgi:hypothetical protein